VIILKQLTYLIIAALLWVAYCVLLGEQVAPEVPPVDMVFMAAAFFFSLCTGIATIVGCILLVTFMAVKMTRRIFNGRDSKEVV